MLEYINTMAVDRTAALVFIMRYFRLEQLKNGWLGQSSQGNLVQTFQASQSGSMCSLLYGGMWAFSLLRASDAQSAYADQTAMELATHPHSRLSWKKRKKA